MKKRLITLLTAACMSLIIAIPAMANDVEEYAVTSAAGAKYVNIPDEVLENVLLEEVDKNGDGRLTAAEMKKLEYLDVYGDPDDIKELDLTGLEYATNLVEVDIYGYQIKDPEILKSFEKLAYLEIVYGNLDDISWISNMKKLKKINFSANNLTTVPDLSGFKNLEDVNFSHNKITDLSLFLGCKCETLRLGGMNFTDLSALREIAKNVSYKITFLPGYGFTWETLYDYYIEDGETLQVINGNVIDYLPECIYEMNSKIIMEWDEHDSWEGSERFLWEGRNKLKASVKDTSIAKKNKDKIVGLKNGKTEYTLSMGESSKTFYIDVKAANPSVKKRLTDEVSVLKLDETICYYLDEKDVLWKLNGNKTSKISTNVKKFVPDKQYLGYDYQANVLIIKNNGNLTKEGSNKVLVKNVDDLLVVDDWTDEYGEGYEITVAVLTGTTLKWGVVCNDTFKVLKTIKNVKTFCDDSMYVKTDGTVWTLPTHDDKSSKKISKKELLWADGEFVIDVDHVLWCYDYDEKIKMLSDVKAYCPYSGLCLKTDGTLWKADIDGWEDTFMGFASYWYNFGGKFKKITTNVKTISGTYFLKKDGTLWEYTSRKNNKVLNSVHTFSAFDVSDFAITEWNDKNCAYIVRTDGSLWKYDLGTSNGIPTLIKEATEMVTLSKTSYVYDGKVKKPTVTVVSAKGETLKQGRDYTLTYADGRKNVGKYAVTIKFKGKYYGSKKVYFTINPKGTSISSLTKSSKAFTVKWKKQSKKMASSRITGYQIQYSTSKDFTSPKSKTVTGYKSTSKKITGLKAKTTYYVRVRTYRTVTVNGKSVKLYSGWSTAKNVKTK